MGGLESTELPMQKSFLAQILLRAASMLLAPEQAPELARLALARLSAPLASEQGSRSAPLGAE